MILSRICNWMTSSPVLIGLIIVLFSHQPLHLYAFDPDNQKKEVNLYIEYQKDFNDVSKIIVSLNTRAGGEITYLEGEKVNLYIDEVSEDGFIGAVSTDESGTGELSSEEEAFRKALKDRNRYEFIALIDDTISYYHDDVTLIIHKSRLDMNCYMEDSVRYVKATLNSLDSAGNSFPREDIEVGFYVKRMLGLLPIGGDYTYTNSDGEITIQFPDDITGNMEGEVDIYVQVEAEDEIGSLTQKTTMNWGKQTLMDYNFTKNALWGDRQNAPMVLIIISNLIILGVWGIILYLIFQIYRIRKIGQKNEHVNE